MNTKLDNILPHDGSVKEAIRIIDSSESKIALIVDEAQRLIGTVTDGDVRRGLLRGIDIKHSVLQIMRTDFSSLSKDFSPEEASNMMKQKRIQQLPILDESGRVIDVLFQFENYQVWFPHPVVIMAGGRGSRLLPHTKEIAKPMLKVNEKPIIEIILEQFRSFGFRNFFISVNYLRETIKSHLKDGKELGIQITYLEESEPLGTCGALRLLPQGLTHSCFVVNGDVLTRVNLHSLLRFHHEQQSSVTMCVRQHFLDVPYGVARVQDSLLMGIEEKPSIGLNINAGLYLLEPSMIDLIKSEKVEQMTDFLALCLERKKQVSVFPIHEYWLDVGAPSTLNKARKEWR